MRTFETGATRDAETGKLDFEGFLSPLVLERFAQYMHKHRTLADGSLRASDNWQAGIPRDVYMKSLFRHFIDAWSAHRGHPARDTLDEALCAMLFNAMGYLHELLVAKKAARPLTLDRAQRIEEFRRKLRRHVQERRATELGPGKPEDAPAVQARDLTELDD